MASASAAVVSAVEEDFHVANEQPFSTMTPISIRESAAGGADRANRSERASTEEAARNVVVPSQSFYCCGKGNAA